MLDHMDLKGRMEAKDANAAGAVSLKQARLAPVQLELPDGLSAEPRARAQQLLTDLTTLTQSITLLNRAE